MWTCCMACLFTSCLPRSKLNTLQESHMREWIAQGRTRQWDSGLGENRTRPESSDGRKFSVLHVRKTLSSRTKRNYIWKWKIREYEKPKNLNRCKMWCLKGEIKEFPVMYYTAAFAFEMICTDGIEKPSFIPVTYACSSAWFISPNEFFTNCLHPANGLHVTKLAIFQTPLKRLGQETRCRYAVSTVYTATHQLLLMIIKRAGNLRWNPQTS